MRQLNTSFVTPFDREDIYRLASALDDVVDAIEAAADFIVLADVGKLPPLMSEQIQLLAALGQRDRRGDVAAEDAARPRAVLDRGQPAGERGRPGLPQAAVASCSAATTTP